MTQTARYALSLAEICSDLACALACSLAPAQQLATDSIIPRWPSTHLMLPKLFAAYTTDQRVWQLQIIRLQQVCGGGPLNQTGDHASAAWTIGSAVSSGCCSPFARGSFSLFLIFSVDRFQRSRAAFTWTNQTMLAGWQDERAAAPGGRKMWFVMKTRRGGSARTAKQMRVDQSEASEWRLECGSTNRRRFHRSPLWPSV